MKKIMFVKSVLLAIALFGFASLTANAAPIAVPGDYATIQAAVNAASAGATITVAAGTYVEQVVIARDLTIKGAGEDRTIIQAPPTLTPFALQSGRPVAAIVRITDGAHVYLSDVTVSGPLPCSDVGVGINVAKNATLELEDAHVTRIRPESGPCPLGPPRGRAITVGISPSVVIDGQNGSNGHAIITDVTVDQYQDAGITVVAPSPSAPSTATISKSTITGGASPFFSVAQSGIALSQAAVAQVTKNSITGNACTNALCGRDPISQVQSSGIGLNTVTTGSSSDISENDVAANDIGIYQIFTFDGPAFSKNNLTDNRYFGIVIQNGSGTTSKNKISGGEVGIAVVANTTDTVGVLKDDKIKQVSVLPVQMIQCCGYIATAVIQ
jgi:hypothetical protein